MKSLLAIAVILSACQAPIPRTACNEIARSPSVPHKFENNGCFWYACAVAPKLKAAGATNIHRITYRWTDGLRSAGPFQGVHTVTAYTDATGNWICDNELPWPKHSDATSILERVQRFAANFKSPVGVEIFSDVAIP